MDGEGGRVFSHKTHTPPATPPAISAFVICSQEGAGAEVVATLAGWAAFWSAMALAPTQAMPYAAAEKGRPSFAVRRLNRSTFWLGASAPACYPVSRAPAPLLPCAAHSSRCAYSFADTQRSFSWASRTGGRVRFFCSLQLMVVAPIALRA